MDVQVGLINRDEKKLKKNQSLAEVFMEPCYRRNALWNIILFIIITWRLNHNIKFSM